MPEKLRTEEAIIDNTQLIVGASAKLFSSNKILSIKFPTSEEHSNIPPFSIIPISEEKFIKIMVKFAQKLTAVGDAILLYSTRFVSSSGQNN